MWDQFFDKDILTKTILDLRIVIPTHWAAIWEDVDRGLDLLCFDRFVDKSGELDRLEFTARSSSMKMIDHGETSSRISRV